MVVLTVPSLRVPSLAPAAGHAKNRDDTGTEALLDHVGRAANHKIRSCIYRKSGGRDSNGGIVRCSTEFTMRYV